MKAPKRKELNAKEKELLTKTERTIGSNQQGFVEVGKALNEIRAKKLYRTQAETFEIYCRKRWQMSRAQAYRLMAASEIFENLRRAKVKTRPFNEAQVRPLVKFGVRFALKIWKRVLSKADNPTASQVTSVTSKLVVRNDRLCNARKKPGKASKPQPLMKVGSLVKKALADFGALNKNKLKKCLERIRKLTQSSK